MLLLSLACWKTETPVEFDVVPFSNELSSGGTGVVETLVTDLDCPDGEPARIVLVYDSEWTEPRPAAIVLHSSAFDYVLNPVADSALTGAHWAGTSDDGVHRMSQAWGVQKVWETLGMYGQVEPAETNLGAVPAAILDAGMVGIYPTNCWGDLWHNSSTDQPNDRGTEFLDREGGTFAWWMVRFLRDATFASTQNITPAVRIDGQTIYLFGLGDGALGVADLLRHDELPAIAGVYLDSPVDDLDQWAETPGIDEGLARIYFDPAGADTGEAGSSYEAWSIRNLLIDGAFADIPGVLVHSSVDPRVPSGNLDALVAKLENKNDNGSANFCIVDTATSTHVQSNADLPMAKDLVDFLLGASSTRCETSDGGSDTGG